MKDLEWRELEPGEPNEADEVDVGVFEAIEAELFDDVLVIDEQYAVRPV